MGWSSATEIFDQVADDLLEANYQFVGDIQEIHPTIVTTPLKNLYRVLYDSDWDTECESKYWDHPVIGIILGNDQLFEE